MATIATITTNPAVDLSAGASAVKPTVKIRCTAPHVQAGGGGINVSRVLHRFGAETLAVFTAGGGTGVRLTSLVKADGFSVRPVDIAGDTRESFTVTERDSGDQYRFVLPGPEIAPAEETALVDAVRGLDGPAYVVHSGSLPPGMSEHFLCDLADAAGAAGARFVIDGPADALSQCRGAWLIKPNLVELETLAGRALPATADRIAFARELAERGVSHNVLISLGEEGALLVTAESATAYTAPRVELVSAVGAGDSMVGGLLAALARGETLEAAAAWGTAAGAAAILTPDTDLCRVEDVERLHARITTERLGEGAPSPR